MLKRKTTRKQERSLAQTVPLALMSPDQKPLVIFPSEIITSFRHTITRLAHSESLPKRIAMVSAMREEGVTFMSLAMATTIANDLRMKVCVVELNWWSPGMARQLNLMQQNTAKQNGTYYPSIQRPVVESMGIAGILRKNSTIDEAIVPTALPNLSLLPAGRLQVEQRPIVARSPELQQVIDTLDRKYDLLILDIPAVLVTSDAIALASLASSCYIVVRHGSTSIENVRQTLDDINHLSVGGVILNQVQTYTPNAVLKLLERV